MLGASIPRQIEGYGRLACRQPSGYKYLIMEASNFTGVNYGNYAFEALER